MSRIKCNDCSFILKRCICPYIIRLHSKIPIVIFRDLNEAKHPFNSVNILKLNLVPLTIVDLDLKDTSTIEIKISEQLAHFKNPLLVFPTNNSIEIKHQSNDSTAFDAIIFLDGTWKKCKKIYFSSSSLQKLPTLQLNLSHKSIYEIRKSKLEFSLSTIEAVAETLSLSDSQLKKEELLYPFIKMIEQQKYLANKKGSE